MHKMKKSLTQLRPGIYPVKLKQAKVLIFSETAEVHYMKQLKMTFVVSSGKFKGREFISIQEI